MKILNLITMSFALVMMEIIYPITKSFALIMEILILIPKSSVLVTEVLDLVQFAFGKSLVINQLILARLDIMWDVLLTA